jgi:hypothetical protein
LNIKREGFIKILKLFLFSTLIISCNIKKEEKNKISKEPSSIEITNKDSIDTNSTKIEIELDFKKDAYEAASCMCEFSNLIVDFSKNQSQKMQIKLEETSKKCTSLFNKIDSIYNGDEKFTELYIKYVAECE